MFETKKNQGKFTQDYPTERKDYPKHSESRPQGESLSYEDLYELQSRVVPLRPWYDMADSESDDDDRPTPTRPDQESAA